MNCHFMKQGEYVLEGDKDQNASLFSFSISRMSVKKSRVETLQRQSTKRLQKLKEEQEKHKKQQKFANILPLQSRSLKQGSTISFSCSFFFLFPKIFSHFQV